MSLSFIAQVGFLWYCFLIFIASLLVSLIFLKLINNALDFNHKKQLSTFIFLPLTTTIIGYFGFGFVFGWGWLMPYSFQPSYWEFKKMCKLNELPNNEEKYDKILAYYDMSLDDIDWKKANKEKIVLGKGANHRHSDYIPNILEYKAIVASKRNKRFYADVTLYTNKNEFVKKNLTFIIADGIWDTKRNYLNSGISYSLEWDKIDISCGEIVPATNIEYYKKRGFNDK